MDASDSAAQSRSRHCRKKQRRKYRNHCDYHKKLYESKPSLTLVDHVCMHYGVMTWMSCLSARSRRGVPPELVATAVMATLVF